MIREQDGWYVWMFFGVRVSLSLIFHGLIACKCITRKTEWNTFIGMVYCTGACAVKSRDDMTNEELKQLMAKEEHENRDG